MNLAEQALTVKTMADVESLRSTMRVMAGGEFKRPVGDNWSNYSILSTSASGEALLLERITNAQDAVVAHEVCREYGFAESSIPYESPREAASSLLDWPANAGHRTERVALGRRVVVAFHDSDESRTRPTITVRDTGSGVIAQDVPFTLCSLAGGNKQNSLWTLGTFGKGGSTRLPFSDATVIVTRRQPELLQDSDEDLVSVVLVRCEYRVKAPAWFYLVRSEFSERDPSGTGFVFTVPAKEVPDFDPGTYIAHVNYDAPNFGRQSLRSDRSIQIVGETRLLDPVLPWRFEDNRSEDNLRMSEEMEGGVGLTFVGSRPKLDSRRGQILKRGHSDIPVVVGGETHLLPVRWWLFEGGGRSSFIAKGTVVAFTNNGQTHSSWNEAVFASKTSLMKVGTRIFGQVESDALPLPVRSGLFNTDRTRFRSSRERQAVEAAVADWFSHEPEIVSANRDLIRDAVRKHVGDDLSGSLLDQINRQLALRGFGSESSNRPRPKIKLLNEPTYLSGPEEVSIVPGETVAVLLEMNAIDRFYPDRGDLATSVDSDFPGTFSNGGVLQRGRVQLRVAVPEGASLGSWTVTFDFGFVSASGSYKELAWETKLRVIEKRKSRSRRNQTKNDGGVAVVWRNKGDEEGWNEQKVGALSEWPADALQEYSPLYAERFADADPDAMVPTLMLNDDYLFLKHYVKATVEGTRTDAAVTRRRRQYALGVSVALGILADENRKAEKALAAGKDATVMSPGQLDAAITAGARGVLTLLPDFDSMLVETGMVED